MTRIEVQRRVGHSGPLPGVGVGVGVGEGEGVAGAGAADVVAPRSWSAISPHATIETMSAAAAEAAARSWESFLGLLDMFDILRRTPPMLVNHAAA
ncbi:hypothetical protein [Arthrobacter rhizosphaerae]|uniref:hypothetical protein n=1 Tax=Arthrobacter rhizosphaerae TaxID=2855490 RepID=UPI001FF32504|nr:hypothetical protein [Arthrobacter rhizosphaerae]